jgi:hypothetical protein
MSVIKTIELFVKNNFSKTEKETKDLNEELGKTAKAQDEVNKSFDAGATFADRYGKELEPLTTRLGEAEDRLYELGLAGDTTSKEYQELLTKVGEYRKVQIQTDLAVDGAATTMTQKLGSALNAATSGFAATQGAIALFGQENEALNESLLKVQSALAIQQGVQGLTEAYKELSIGTKLASGAQALFSTVVGGTSGALKVFRVALISTGIGAIVVGLGLLIANFDKVSNFVRKAVDGFDKLGGVMKIILFPITAVIEAFKLVQQGLQAIGVIESEEDKAKEARYQANIARIEAENEARKQAFDARQKQFDREIALLEAEGKSSFELRQQKIKDSIAVQKQEIEAYKTTLRIFENSPLAAAAAEVVKQYKKQVETLNESIKDQENQLAINVINNNKKKADSYKQLLKDKKKADQEALDEEIDAEIQLLAELDKIRQENEDRFKTEEEKELDEVEQKYDVLESMAYGNAEALNEIEIARLNERNNILLKYENIAYDNKKALDDKADADEKARRAKQLEDIKAYQEAEQAIRMANLDNAAAGVALLKDLAGENRKLQALGIAAENAVGIAKIIISTQAANAAAKLKYAAIPGGLALAAAEITANKISAGIGIAASIAAAAKGISALKESASLDSGGGLGGDSGAGGGEVISPEFNVVGDAGINQLAQLQQQPTQAYVVSGEVTSAQALDRNRVTNATL